jgi:hypothetical protein
MGGCPGCLGWGVDLKTGHELTRAALAGFESVKPEFKTQYSLVVLIFLGS